MSPSPSPRGGINFGAGALDGYDFSAPPPLDPATLPVRAPLRIDCTLVNPGSTQRLYLLATLASDVTPPTGLRIDCTLDNIAIDTNRPRPQGGAEFASLVSLTRSGSVATATTSGAHGMRAGAFVAIRAADQEGYIGDWRVATVPSSTTFTFAIADTPATPATGSIQWRQLAPGGPAPFWPGADQVLGLIVKIGGVEVPSSRIGNVSVHRDREQGGSWTFDVAMRGESPDEFTTSPVGAPSSFLGPAPGLAEVDITGLVWTPAGVVSYPLITGGIVHQQASKSSPWRDAVNGTDRRGRYDKALVTDTLKPGHGLYPGEIAANTADQVGIPSTQRALDKGENPVMKELQWIDVGFFGANAELLDAKNRLLYFDKRGRLVNPLRVGSNVARRGIVTLSLDERDTLDGSVGKTMQASVPTTITLTSTMQIVREGCERTTSVTVSEVFTDYAPRVALSNSAGPGAVSTTYMPPSQPAATRQLVQRTIKIVEKDCDDVVSEREVVQRWFNPRAARYVSLTSGRDPINGPGGRVYFYTVATPDGDEEAYHWPEERFATVSDTRTAHIYNESGQETQTVVRRGGWYQRRRALKIRGSDATEWGSVPYSVLPVNHNFWLASGEAVRDATERWFSTGGHSAIAWGGGYIGLVLNTVVDLAAPDLAVETTTINVSPENTIKGTATTKYGFVIRGGSLNLYHDGSQSSDAEETMAISEVTTEAVVEESESSHSVIRTFVNASTGEYREEHDTDMPGVAPVANVRGDVDVDPALYANSDQQAQGRVASRYETKTIKVSVEAPALLVDHVEYELKAQPMWPENEGELTSLCMRMLREGSATRVSYETPCNFGAEENTFTHLTDRALGLDDDVEIESLDWAMPADGPWTTSVEGIVSILEGTTA